MTIRTRLAVFLLLVLILKRPNVGYSVEPGNPPYMPNILILLADDLGWGDIGLHGGIARTPNIDRLAQEGIELRQYYAYPFCSPTRAAMLTGQMPRRFGIVHALQARDAGLPLGLPTLPKTLKASGYQTMLVGKWHLGHSSHPLNSGFDDFYGFLGPEIDCYTHTSRNGQVDWQRNGKTIHEAGYSTFLLADEAVYLIEERDVGRPFFLQVSFNAPHFPLAAPPEYEAKYPNLRRPAVTRVAMIDALDNAIGRILETLDEQGLRKETLVMFLSDNGADQSGRNAPFRGGKGSTFEGGIHVPCLIRWPQEIAAGSVCQQPVTAQDLYPTLVAAAALSLNIEIELDGKDLWPSIRFGQEKKRGPFLISAANSALFDESWKFIETEGGKTMLFDLSRDPGETRDLISEQPAIAQRLQAQLREIKQTFPAIPSRGPPGRPR
jgi:arylsulfatase A-like enzyme